MDAHHESRALTKVGWIPDLPDHRDWSALKLFHATRSKRPYGMKDEVDLRPSMPPVVNQGEIGSCTACATSAAYQYLEIRAGKKVVPPSLLYLYYNSRAFEGTKQIDAGAQLRHSLKAVRDYGLAPDELWPYRENLFWKSPPIEAYGHAIDRQGQAFYRLDNADRGTDDVTTALSMGLPVIFGATLYESFENGTTHRTGVVEMPSGKMIGGHAMLCVGYLRGGSQFIVRNSWGAGWGIDGGYCLFPKSYLAHPDLVADLWVLSSIEE